MFCRNTQLRLSPDRELVSAHRNISEYKHYFELKLCQMLYLGNLYQYFCFGLNPTEEAGARGTRMSDETTRISLCTQTPIVILISNLVVLSVTIINIFSPKISSISKLREQFRNKNTRPTRLASHTSAKGAFFRQKMNASNNYKHYMEKFAINCSLRI